jgi:L-ascorbate metabolism protein UlaG (beta-lactamase superfamily)
VIEPLQSDDTFLADVESASRDESASREARSIHLWWLGQSGYLITWQGRRAVLDPYLSESLTEKYKDAKNPHVRMTRRVVDPARLRSIDVVTSSHSHTDHLDADTLKPLVKSNPKLRFIAPRSSLRLAEERLGRTVDFPMDAGETVDIDGIQIHAVPAAHDRLDKDAQGCFMYLGYILKLGSFTLYHSGDTIVYDGMTEQLRPFKIDLAILPINNKLGNMDGVAAARVAKDMGAKLVIPCHYEMFEFNTASPAEFVAECEKIGQPYRLLRAGERFDRAEGA